MREPINEAWVGRGPETIITQGREGYDKRATEEDIPECARRPVGAGRRRVEHCAGALRLRHPPAPGTLLCPGASGKRSRDGCPGGKPQLPARRAAEHVQLLPQSQGRGRGGWPT